ncbi:glycosyltransferase family 2 protein [Sulfurospirillum sp.]|uniref:glycosyltransferase family 2 protein n=1 Tax=Sulfurospirillum sp. TaxID=2053622 RepID=UPI002FDDD67C
MKSLFSIVVPIYKSEMNISVAIERIEALKNNISNEFDVEVIFVDDGSPDNSFKLLSQYKQTRDWIKIVKFTRNFGVPNGILAGLSYVKGDCAVVLVPDMQDPPELLTGMLEEWKNGYKIVLAEREDREEPKLQKIISNTFHLLMKNFALPNYPSNGSDLILLDRVVVNYLNEMKEKNTNYLSLILWSGYEYKKIYYVRKKRELGKSSFTFGKKLKYAIDSFLSFSYMPIRAISSLGLLVACLSFLYGVFIFINALFGNMEVRGYATIVVLITFLLGLIILILGIIAEYLWRILDEAKNRPRYIIEEELL